MDIRSEIKGTMDSLGLSIRQLSLKSGVRRQSIMHFLKGGNIHLGNLEKVLATLGYELSFSKKRAATGKSKTSLQRRIFASEEGIKMFCKERGITYLAVFGSVLRGDFNKGSDIDVLINFDRPVSFFELEEIEAGLKSLFKTDHKLDVLTINSVSPLIKDEIDSNLEVLYEKAA